jgi:phosphate-selective porin OprO/OprP
MAANRSSLFRHLAGLQAFIAIFSAVILVNSLRGQEPRTTDAELTRSLRSMQDRIDQLEKQLSEQRKNLTTVSTQQSPEPASSSATVTVEPPDNVRTVVADVLKEQAAKKAADEAAAKEKSQKEGVVVGSLLGLKGTFTNGPGSGGYQPWLESEDKAFRFHVGARMQPDFVFGAGADKNVQQGIGGTGPFLEGANMRRARLQFDGWVFENIDFDFEYDFSNTVFNTGTRGGNQTPDKTPTNTQPFSNLENAPGPADVWASINYMPVIGGFRVGILKPAIGLDHLTSSRFLDFMERSSGFDTYYNRNNGFEPGFMFFNHNEEKTATYQLSITRTSNGPFGFNQGGGAWDYSGRLTWLPYFEDDGRYMMHLGIGAKWQGLDRSTGVGIANFNTRWLLRNGQSGLQDVVALAVLTGQDQAIVNPEFFMNIGSLSIQSEYIASQVNGVTNFATQLTPKSVNVPSRSFYSQSAYIQAMYFLTGEYRPYGRTAVHGSGAAPTRVVPLSNFFWLPGESGNIFSKGAWQVGARYCYTNLEDGQISGGVVNEVTLGLNWFLNPNMKFQWNYALGHRELQGGTSNGNYYGFGMRMAMDF